MYTQCPECKTWFEVRPAELRSAEGQVRCSRCHAVFGALSSLTEHVPPPDTDTAPSTENVEPTARPARAAVDILLDDLNHAPQRSSGLGTTLWALAILGLLGLFIVQYAYFERDRLARIPELRPTLARLCHYARCELPPLRAPQLVSIVDRTIVTHPFVEGALLIDATIVNQAKHPQPYPRLRLNFSDLRGQVIAGREFTPAEYLSEEVNPSGEMAVGQPVHIILEVYDPGNAAVNFEFSFR